MPETNSNGRKQTILIVDDAPDNLALMSSLLNTRYKTKVATTGEKALEVASFASPPDLILLDVMMPGMDGYEVCRRLKENPKTADIPVIFLTGKSDAADEQKGLELGAVDRQQGAGEGNGALEGVVLHRGQGDRDQPGLFQGPLVGQFLAAPVAVHADGAHQEDGRERGADDQVPSGHGVPQYSRA